MEDEKLFEKPKTNLVAVTKGVELQEIGPEELSAFGALACFEEKTGLELCSEYKSKLSNEEFDNKKEAVIKNSVGMGHGSVADQNYFIYSIENLTRAATFQLCLPHYLAHLQQSLRRAKAERGFFVPEEIRESELFPDVKQILSDAFRLYEKMSANGIPSEDARFILPLYTKTNIQTGGDARELIHLHAMNRQGEVPSAVSNVIETMISEAEKTAPKLFKDRGKNYEVLAWYPSAQLYASTNKTISEIIERYGNPQNAVPVSYQISERTMDEAVKNRNEAELANLKHIHNGGILEAFLAPMSLACYHQATRQRTWDQSIESIYAAVERKKASIPPSIEKSGFLEEYKAMNEKMFELYKNLVNKDVPRKEAVGVIPHALQIYDLIHVNGWNAIHSIGKRTCTQAQWEIRGIAKEIANHIKRKDPAIGKYTEPQCVIYGYCPERKPCGYYEEYLKKTPKLTKWSD